MGCGYLSIIVQTKGFCSRTEWQIFDIVDIVRKLHCWRNIVDATWAEGIVILEDIRSDILLEDCFDQTYIFVIGYSTSIVDLRT